MGSILDKGFGLIQMQLSNRYYNAVFEKSKLLKWFPALSVFSGFSDKAQVDPFRIHAGIRTLKLSWKFAA